VVGTDDGGSVTAGVGCVSAAGGHGVAKGPAKGDTTGLGVCDGLGDSEPDDTDTDGDVVGDVTVAPGVALVAAFARPGQARTDSATVSASAAERRWGEGERKNDIAGQGTQARWTSGSPLRVGTEAVKWPDVILPTLGLAESSCLVW
jgi:hypothetical protein